jgi:hypothetical protein
VLIFFKPFDFDFSTFFQIENYHAWFENQIQIYAKKPTKMIAFT